MINNWYISSMKSYFLMISLIFFYYYNGLNILLFSFFLFLFLKSIKEYSNKSYNFMIMKDFIKINLLELKSKTYNFNFININFFLMIFISNYIGLLVLLPQNFLSKLSFGLLLMSFSMWFFTYSTMISNKKEKISLFMIGEMKFPSLSLLLSNIEILTHLFRPITLTARLWVNIWVGHLILSAFSFILTFLLSVNSFLGTLKIFLSSSFFFIFESLIMFLQTFVFTYLIKVYFEENEHHSMMKI